MVGVKMRDQHSLDVAQADATLLHIVGLPLRVSFTACLVGALAGLWLGA